MELLILNGPNLNLLGKREASIYGSGSFSDYLNEIREKYKEELVIHFKQSNAEHELIDIVHANSLPLVFNPAAFTHTSIALRDALLAVNSKFVEVHISNVYKREKFRQYSYFSDIAQAVIVGAGLNGYEMALQYHLLNR